MENSNRKLLEIWNSDTWIIAETSKCKTSSSLSQLQRLADLTAKISELEDKLIRLRTEDVEEVEQDLKRCIVKLQVANQSLQHTASSLMMEQESLTKSSMLSKAKLDKRRETLQTDRLKWEEAVNKLTVDHQSCLDTKTRQLKTLEHTVNRRQAELILDLSLIYPIKLSSPPTIAGLPLPNSVYDGYRDDVIATALGHTAHVISLVALYVDVRLWYPITPQSSTSLIKDPINKVYQSNPTFPLYRTADTFRWEYAVYLLNKDIEQLLNSLGVVEGYRLRDTLINTHKILLIMAKRGDLEEEFLE